MAFLYTGQGSQYVNMLATLRKDDQIVADTFAEADTVMTPLLGRPLSELLFVDPADPAAVTAADEQLRQTEITQPAILTVDIALTRLLASYGIEPAMVMGHSLGEYGALVASGALSFADALEAVSARGREMTNVAIEDCGRMAAVFAPLEEIERVLAEVDGYVVIANINSRTPGVVGGATAAVEAAVARLIAEGHQAILLPVSHAFHTEIVAAAAEPLKAVLRRLRPRVSRPSPSSPTSTATSTRWDPTSSIAMIDLLGRQIASPVQFVKGLCTLYDAGCPGLRRGRSEAGAPRIRRGGPWGRPRCRLDLLQPSEAGRSCDRRRWVPSGRSRRQHWRRGGWRETRGAAVGAPP